MLLRPIAVDLFAGAGGLSLGFEQAGFDVVAAVELDPVHCAIHKFNFPHCAILPQSVAGLSGSEIRDLADIGDVEIDCVFGGPPCQGFSTIGHRALDDPRNALVTEFVRIVAELRPRSFVFENVKGLVMGRHKAFLAELVTAFDVAGYDVRLPWRVLDAASYGVPQHRERLFLMGSRRGSMPPRYPKATAQPADERSKLASRPIGPTCQDAIGDLPDADLFESLSQIDFVEASEPSRVSRYGAEMRCRKRAAWHYGYVRIWDSQLMTSSWRTEHTDISRRRFAETDPGTTEAISRFYKLSSDGLSNTLRAGTDGARGAFTSPRPIHYAHPRCVTVREMARLHGFPDWFRFHWTKWHGARQIGNAVPPPLARAVAREVLRSLDIEPSVPREAIALGEPELLYMDTSEAARHFGVSAPTGRRDRKSGAKKRKQSDIEAERLAMQESLRG